MKLRALVPAVAAALLLTVACAPIQTAEPEAEQQAAPAGPADLDPTATIRYADVMGPSRFDPHRSTIGQDIRFLAPVYDRLVHLSPEGKPVPGLATAWSWENDGLTLRLELREGVTFHDGAPFNAEAVRANIERGKTVEGSSVDGDLAVIKEVEVAGEYTALLHLNHRSSMLPGLLSHRAGAMVSPTAFENPDLDLAPVGAGMYKVTEYRPGDVIVYERFEDYWDDSVVGAARIEIDILPDEVTRMNALRTGEVDVARLAARRITAAEAIPGVTVHQDTTLTYLVLYLNRARSEFDDPRVRKALNLAIDRKAILEGIYFGSGQTVVQPFPPEYFAHNPDYPGDFYPYDPERARQLLAEAGLSGGFEFEMLVPTLTTYVQGAEAVKNMLAEVGITANLRSVEPAQTADVYYAQEQGDALIAQWGGRPDPLMTIDLQFSADGFGNPGGHTTPRLEQLLEEALNTLDEQKRQEKIHQIVGELVENAFQVPILSGKTVVATTERIVGYDTMMTGQPNFRTLGVRKQ